MRSLVDPLTVLALAAAAAGCGKSDAPSSAAPVPAATAAQANPSDSPAPKTGDPCKASGVVTMQTDDGVKLEADLHLTGTAGGPAAVLLHMIPPHHDRTGYPKDLIAKLTDAGITVLNVDRRGAGKSDGKPEDAYKGPSGKLDVKAAFDFLAGHGCAPNTARIAYVGASNGTTSALDFTVLAANDSALAAPRALVFLTGGAYTEAQNEIENHRELLHEMPILWVYSEEEKAWSAAFLAMESPMWMFKEYAGGAHGTKMFGAKPESVSLVVTWLGNALE